MYSSMVVGARYHNESAVLVFREVSILGAGT